MNYERDEAMRQQEATEAMIRMRDPRSAGMHPDPLLDRTLVAKALWKMECEWLNRDRAKQKLPPVERWADPWDESGCGIRQQEMYLRQADDFIAAIKSSQT